MIVRATTGEIAKALGVTDRAVRKRLRELGVKSIGRSKIGGQIYTIDVLPRDMQTALARRALAAAPAVKRSNESDKQNGQSVNLAGLSGKKFTRAQMRLAVLAALQEFRRVGNLGLREAEHLFAADYNAGKIAVEPAIFAAIPSLSATSLCRWRRFVSTAGAARLAGNYRGRREAGKIDGNPALRDILIAALTHAPHLGARQLLEQLEARVAADALPSLRRLQIWMARWKDENKSFFELVTNPDGYRNRFMPAFGSADENIVRVNQLWEIDDTRGDIGLIDGRRVLIALIDVASRRGMTLLTESANSGAVLGLIRRAILAWGMPEAIKSDNGSNYTSRQIEAALAALEIRHPLCNPYSPWEKPHIERFIGTIQHDLFEQLPGYVGHSVAERQAIRARESFARRMGASDAEIFRVSMSAADLQLACDTWSSAKYAHAPHDALGRRAPAEIATEQAHLARPIADERALDVLLAEPAGGGSRIVGKKGIELDGTFFIHGELAAFIGQRVQVRWDATDAGRVHVYAAGGDFVCIAEAPERTGADRRAVAAYTKALRKKIDAAGRTVVRTLHRQVRPERLIIESLARAAAEKGGDAAVPFHAEAITTKALEAAADAANSLANLGRDAKAPFVANVVTLPARGADGRLQKPANLGDDVAYAAWLLDDPANGNAEDRAWLARMLRSWEFRQSLEINGILKADGRAAG